MEQITYSLICCCFCFFSCCFVLVTDLYISMDLIYTTYTKTRKMHKNNDNRYDNFLKRKSRCKNQNPIYESACLKPPGVETNLISNYQYKQWQWQILCLFPPGRLVIFLFPGYRIPLAHLSS